MDRQLPVVLGAIASMVAAGGEALWAPHGNALAPQQPQPSNPQPQPANPQPQPANPSPRPANPQPRPNDPIPGRPGDAKQPEAEQPRRPGDPEKPTDRLKARNLRPFAFQNPQMEGTFTQSAERLVRMEEKFTQSNQAMLKRLGEARRLDGDRQNKALLDIVQELLMNQNELHQYLVQSRTAWTGDIETESRKDQQTTAEPR